MKIGGRITLDGKLCWIRLRQDLDGTERPFAITRRGGIVAAVRLITVDWLRVASNYPADEFGQRWEVREPTLLQRRHLWSNDD